MNREYHRWYSHNLGRDMELLIFGSSGLPVIVYPTSLGSFFEFEDRGMVAALGDKIDAGYIQLYCVDSVNSDSWYNRGAHPRYRVLRHLQYETYILDEVIPLTRTRDPDRPDQRVAMTGCSLGAYQSALIALRHPWAVSRMIALSGMYDNSSFLNGYSDLETYLTNPLAFIRGLSDHAILEAMRAMNIVVVTGSTDPHVDQARELSRVLWDKAVPNTLDVWDGWMHDWPYWHVMIRKHL